jgi:hypothetical protein
MPADQIVAQVPITEPSENSAASSLTRTRRRPSRTSTPAAASAAVITGRGPGPSAGPTTELSSARTTRVRAPGAIRRSRAGRVLASSMPAKPAPMTTTVSRAALRGRADSPCRCWSSRVAPTIVSTLNRCAAPGTPGTLAWLPEASTSRS